MDCIDCTCPLFTWLELFERKWNLRIVRELYRKNRGFNELKHSIKGITQGVLSQRLDELRKNSIITRKIVRQKPLTVEYELAQNVRKALSCWQPLKKEAKELKIRC